MPAMDCIARRTISIHALREEGDWYAPFRLHSPFHISIHALREEGDTTSPVCGILILHFYPRPPRGGRRWSVWRTYDSRRYFYPRPPRGGRRARVQAVQPGTIFLSTPSARRATAKAALPYLDTINFYPRPPRGGRLTHSWTTPRRSMYFYPRPPRGGRRAPARPAAEWNGFLSTPSARRATDFQGNHRN